MMDAITRIGAIVGLVTGAFTLWDRLFRARPIAYVHVQGRQGNWFRYVRIVNTDKADMQVANVRCWPQFFSAAKDHSEPSIADAMDGRAPLALIAPGEHWDFPLVPRRDLSSLGDKRFALAISWRRSSSPWLPQPPKWIVLSMRDLRRLEENARSLLSRQ